MTIALLAVVAAVVFALFVRWFGIRDSKTMAGLDEMERRAKAKIKHRRDT